MLSDEVYVEMKCKRGHDVMEYTIGADVASF